MYVAFRHLTDSPDFSLSEIELILLIGDIVLSLDLSRLEPNKGSETELMLPIGDIVLSLDLSRLEPNKSSETELILDVSM